MRPALKPDEARVVGGWLPRAAPCPARGPRRGAAVVGPPAAAPRGRSKMVATHRTHRNVDEETQAKIDAIKTSATLEAPPVPKRPVLSLCMSHRQKMVAMNRYICAFEYNHTGRGYYVMKRDRGLKHVTTTAKEIMREALPIQCVEAVFLGIILTSEMPDLLRFPVSFKSACDGNVYRHIVLAVHDTKEATWGALGISRRKKLQFKDPTFASLGALVGDYRKSYEACDHDLVKVYVGLPLPTSVHSMEPVKWRVLKMKLEPGGKWADAAAALDRYVKDSGWIREYHARTGKLPAPFGKADGDAPEKHGADAAAPAANSSGNDAAHYLCSPSRVHRKAALPSAASASSTKPRRRRAPRKATPSSRSAPSTPSVAADAPDADASAAAGPAPAPDDAADDAPASDAPPTDDAETEPDPDPGDGSDTSDSDAEDV